MRTLAFVALSASFFPLASVANDADTPEIKWTVSTEPVQARDGDEVEIRFVADLPEGIIVYASDFDAALGPRPARISFDPSADVELSGPLQALRSQPGKDKVFGTDYTYFDGRAELVQKVRLLKGGTRLSGRIEGQTCQLKDGLCTLFREPFAVDLD